jgi:hypothetical protein
MRKPLEVRILVDHRHRLSARVFGAEHRHAHLANGSPPNVAGSTQLALQKHRLADQKSAGHIVICPITRNSSNAVDGPFLKNR